MVVYCTSAVAGQWFILHDLVDVSLTHLLLTLHGAAACAVLLAVGSLLRVHVRAGLLRRSIVAQPSVRSAPFTVCRLSSSTASLQVSPHAQGLGEEAVQAANRY